jgi:hypothetical protein
MTASERAFVRLTRAVERVAQAVEHQERPAVERVPLADVELRPQAVDHQQLNVTGNAASPIRVGLRGLAF